MAGSAAGRPPTRDHLPKQKKPIEVRVPIALAGEPFDALDEAREELAAAQTKAEQERDRLFHLCRTPGATPAELLELDRQIGAQVDETLKPLQDAVEAAEAAAAEATQVYVFRSIGRANYKRLLDAHPPRDEDHEATRRDTGNENALSPWNADTFPQALVMESCADPLLTEADVAELVEDWNDSEFVTLFTAALAVNQQRRVVDLGKGRG